MDGVNERLLDITTVADRLGTSVRHVRRLVFERRIPHTKVGGLVRFDPTAVDDWLDERRRGPESHPRRTTTRRAK
jgi:excisionase family DNA binding protein